ncbi:unnamed protein product [Psylliodes chrysocephalus]|uniref:Uncharacterized protein n=1 Tax=Psylliodes chrysocephalus TaxID=3402493 RepID=A0A9P0D5S6_9CUCU|nr:unnamed protein product [Psylliodes chrysocephala]
MGNLRKKKTSSSSEDSSSSSDEFELLKLKNKLLKRKLNKQRHGHGGKKRRHVSSSEDGRSSEEDAYNESEKEKEQNSEQTDPLGIEFVEVPSLSGEILEVLGPKQATVSNVSEDIHKDLVIRWEQIIKKGLNIDDREELLKKYPHPQNFVSLCSPKVNPEINEAIDAATKKRDEKLQSNQKIMVAAISALGKALTFLIDENKENTPLSLIEPINDASKLVAELFKDQTLVRQSLISKICGGN